MTQSQIGRDSLVLFKGKPAIIARTGQKLELLLQDGETVSVRPKDVALLHRGPASFAALKPPQVTWRPPGNCWPASMVPRRSTSWPSWPMARTRPRPHWRPGSGLLMALISQARPTM